MSHKELIVRAAARLFHQRGPHGVETGDILALAEVTAEQYAGCFSSREQLVAEVAAFQMGRILAHLQPHMGRMESWQDLERWQEGALSLVEIAGNLGCPLGILAADEAGPAQQAVRDALLEFSRLHVKGLASLKRHGVFREEFDPREAAQFTGAVLQGSLLLGRAFQDADVLRRCLDQLRVYLETFRA